MKGWTDRQVFFVFDTEFCQNEGDDPKDAIVYFRPHETTESVRCTLCCQLMGISRFLHYGFAPVSLIRLDKGKFATRTIGKYSLALKGNPDMPDSILQRQLDRLVSLFTFHFKDFDSIQRESLGSRNLFLEKMAAIWNALVPISQHGGNAINLTFCLVPSVDLPKTAGILHLQAAQLLQACQWHDTVLVGCIMCNDSVLHSQLPTSVLHNLTYGLTSDKAAFPGEVPQVKFDIPGGVALTYVYLTRNELSELSKSTATNTLSTTRTHRKARTNCEAKKKCQEVEETENRASEHMNQECILTKVSEEIADSKEIPLDDPLIKEGSQSPTINKKISPPSDTITLLYESHPENSEELESSDTEPRLPEISSEIVHALIEEKVSSLSEALSDVSVEETPPQDDANEQNDCEAMSSLELELENDVELYRVVLYIQHCNDSTLVLLMETDVTTEADVIHALWKLGLNSLTALEQDVKNCLEMSPSKDTRDKRKYHYLQYEKKWQTAKGNLLSTRGSSLASQHSFNRNVQLIHEEFQADPNLHEMTLRAKEHVIYGHQIGSKETFYQHRCHKEGTGKSVSRTDSIGALPFPHQNDAVATISTTSKRQLEIDHKIILL